MNYVEIIRASSRNFTGLMKRKFEDLLSDFVWPWWFPYPSSWLRTALLVPLAFPFNVLILSGIVGIFISASEQNWAILVFSIIAGLILPTLILSL
ncbi:hypothetical protein [Oscillatoria sp. FACHB-1406]|uniref:hypothetical protein n=1 Tax=Oscillatoria sp. FACHB-1406 TaxID=2692846 RepID=UPI0016891D3C|nr:hypothetical protein [Oscillatoria sp. FACHB-1406]MBD2577522.1 hypothetical protein [Oscillatoria sp. FACHB-1406]